MYCSMCGGGLFYGGLLAVYVVGGWLIRGCMCVLLEWNDHISVLAGPMPYEELARDHVLYCVGGKGMGQEGGFNNKPPTDT